MKHTKGTSIVADKLAHCLCTVNHATRKGTYLVAPCSPVRESPPLLPLGFLLPVR